MIPYSSQTIENDDIKEVEEVLKSSYLTQGPKVKEFEKNLAKKVQAKYVVTFSSGTSALLGLYFSVLKNFFNFFKDPKDFYNKKRFYFITTPITFSATSNAALYLGGIPIFVDIKKDGNIDLEKLYDFLERLKKKYRKIFNNIKFITIVHYAGNPVDTKKAYEIGKIFDKFILEDACHALGAYNKYETIGSCKYSLGATFSFHPVKPIACGEGGAVATNNKKIFETLLLFKNHGIKRKDAWIYDMYFLSLNHRLSDVHAALGNSQLKKLDKFLNIRRNLAKVYYKLFENINFAKPIKQLQSSSYHLFPVRFKFKNLKQKKIFFNALREKGLGVQVHYIPIYMLSFYKNLFQSFKEIYESIYNTLELKYRLKESYSFYREEISIPLSQNLKEKDIYNIFEVIIDTYKKFVRG